MKKVILLFINLFSVFALTGFVKVDYSINVSEEEIAEVKLIVKVDDKYNKTEVEKYIMKNFSKNLKSYTHYDYTYNTYETEKYTVFVVIARYPETMRLGLLHFSEFQLPGNSSGNGTSLLSIKRDHLMQSWRFLKFQMKVLLTKVILEKMWKFKYILLYHLQ